MIKRKRLPPLKALKVFEVAARSGSFARAAQELCVTQTAVSHQIKILEEFVGGLLFERLANGLVLTPLGHTCLLYTSPSPRDRQKSRMPSSA